MSEKILIIEDEPAYQAMLVEALSAKGYQALGAGSAEEGLARLGREPFDLIITDVMLPGISGLESIELLKAACPEADIIVMTAYSSRESALQAVRKGAYDYFSKPFSLSELEIVIRRALERRSLKAELKSLRLSLRAGGPVMVGQSEAMRRVNEMIARVAELDTTVLVTGESGTGKELVSDTIHHLSRRSQGPHIKVNCAAIPENLLESELFGHEKGAFTGAMNQKKGKFELAHGGTIMLDEIGDMPLTIQPKILRAVEQKQIERLGGLKPIEVDVRIVAATNQPLPELIDEKKFRADLYYRLSVATVQLPPLRERKEDIPLLASHFLDKINLKLGTNVSGLSSEAMHYLFEQAWPGNVRQFANVLERAVIMSRGEILSLSEIRQALELGALPEAGKPGQENIISLREALEEVERTMIDNAMRKAGNIQQDAAKLLGISPKNLWNKLQKHKK